MFDLLQLKSFVAVAEEGSINRAAARLHVTQPALSRRIRALEDEIGQLLLTRGGNSVRLTEAGKAMLDEARAVLARADEALVRVRAAGSAPPFRIGYSPSLAGGILAPAVAAFSQLHPRTRIDMLDLDNREMTEGLCQGKLDLAVTALPAKTDAGTVWEAVVSREFRVALARTHPLAALKSLAPEDLDGERAVLYCRSDYPDYWELVTSWFREHKVNAKVAGEYDGATSLMAAVEAGLGFAFVSENSGLISPSGVVMRRLSPPPAPLTIAAGVPADRADDGRTAVFIAELRRAAKHNP